MLEDDAEVMSNTQLDELITGQPPDVEQEILAINEDAVNISLQVALAIPLVAALLGIVNRSVCCGFRTSRHRRRSMGWTLADPRDHDDDASA